ncbi:hypothetical protein GUITHDRAFT_106096 [Guillardia theta CCMP2712]|uniref:Uncharacterized protein n=1 Tax=Guillardia theta (strain CCMP2712) TaxID=905079 RepID=L1JHN8_GUITC|nr:hypothetical protein GUITHDRAFT_106096 [Guillardia theta CCMP2712]EKX48011.1 hypothetical protein GUITHDRAFT_106096 [Guillardia theta CCMP2712]|eukprot:XP_005834991.1 hypothetical protein GUITHDRAFT_106096 [Guillardia theta CCMP2712]
MKSSFLGVLIALVGNSLIGTSFSVMKVVVNVPFAYFILGEKLSFRNILGCILCILGGYGIVGVVANNTSEHETVTVEQFEKMAFRPTFMVFFTISVMESIDLIWSRRKTVMTYIWICSLLGGLTVLSIKAVTSFMVITFQGSNQFGNLLPKDGDVPVSSLNHAGQVHFLNKAIADYGTGEVVPTYYVIFTSCAVLGSAILLAMIDLFVAQQHIRSIEASDGDDQETLL